MRLKALKVEIEHLQLLMDKAKVKLQKEFEVWWAEEATSLQVCCGEHWDSVLYKLGSLQRQWGEMWLSNLRPVGTGHWLTEQVLPSDRYSRRSVSLLQGLR